MLWVEGMSQEAANNACCRHEEGEKLVEVADGSERSCEAIGSLVFLGERRKRRGGLRRCWC
jgi:hypothetical protein